MRPVPQEAVEALGELIGDRRRIAILTGAGCSTESGIPDYRSPGGLWEKHTPITYQAFTGSAPRRRRYWARSMMGWSRFHRAQPNDAHRALARLEASGRVRGLITQNVDRLHLSAGSRAVVELHGDNHHVVCLGCQRLTPRGEMQTRMEALNPHFTGEIVALRPDGDAELGDAAYDDFIVPSCEACGGMLKTHVVFFGETVPKARVAQGFEWVDGGDLLLVLGTSLTVWSGYRFVKRAVKEGVPVAAVNIGPTRGDGEIALKVEGRVGEVLPRLLTHLGV